MTKWSPHMVRHYLSGVVLLCSVGELPKVIHQGSHAWGQVQHVVDQLSKRDLLCNQRNTNHSGKWLKFKGQYLAEQVVHSTRHHKHVGMAKVTTCTMKSLYT